MSDKKILVKDKLIYVYMLVILYVLMTAGMILGKVTAKDIWYDEVFSVIIARLDLKQMFIRAAMDVHPPLYYIYLKACVGFWGVFGIAEITACKLASCIPMLALIVFSFTWVRKRHGLAVMTAFLVMIVMMPQLATYYVEIRMYSFALMCVTFAYAAMEDILYDETPKIFGFVIFFVMSLAAAYTQYFACIGIIAVYIMLLIGMIVTGKERTYFKRFILMAVGSIVLYAPWLPSFYKQITEVTGSFWIQPMTLRSIPGCLKFIFKPDIANTKLAYLIAGALILFCAIQYIILLRKNRNKKELVCACTGPASLILIVGVGYIFSFMGCPIFTYRYMIPMLGILYLNIACISFSKKNNAYITTALLLFMLAGYISFNGFYAEETKKSGSWKTAAEELEKIEEGSCIITNFDHVASISAFYLRDADVYIYEGSVNRIIMELLGGCEPVNDESVKNLVKENDSVYFFGSFNSRDEICDAWEEQGIHAEYLGECLVERYWFNIYRLSENDK